MRHTPERAGATGAVMLAVVGSGMDMAVSPTNLHPPPPPHPPPQSTDMA